MSRPHLAIAIAFSLAAACGDTDAAAPDSLATASDATASDATAPDATAATHADTAADTTTSADTTADDTTTAADTADSADADAVDPDPDFGARGPYHVAYRTDEVTYTAPDGSGERTLRLAVWYPTSATTGDEVLYAGLLPAEGVLGFAPPADLGPRPVVVFSHGNSSFAEQSFFLTEHLASHGYLVAAPDHTGNTFTATFDVAVFHWRPRDVTAVLDHLAALPAEHPLRGLASDAVAVVGHSFGGYTTLAVGGATWDVDGLLALCADDVIPLGGCAALEAHAALYRAGFLDARVDALVPMTPGATFVFGSAGVAAIAPPTLLMTGARDATTPNASEGDPTWAQLATRPGNVRVDFANAGHFTFSDACALPLGIGADDGCGPTFLAPDAAHRAINAYTLAFLARHLADDTRGDALLAGEVVIEPDATVTTATTVAPRALP